jgi:hypothetical protein
MFEKIAGAAEKLATNVSESRRGFLARVGKAALGVVGVVSGLLALPREAQATTYWCCYYVSGQGGYMRRCFSHGCPQQLPLFWNLWHYRYPVGSCSQC